MVDRGIVAHGDDGLADGTTSGFWGPELQVDVGEFAIWAMGADREAITKQEVALAVLRAMRAMANGGGRR